MLHFLLYLDDDELLRTYLNLISIITPPIKQSFSVD